jgi:FMN phosphatase YigB (HAD superfamily)
MARDRWATFDCYGTASELGLRSIWINRYGERHDPPPTRELADLSRLLETLDDLVAA